MRHGLPRRVCDASFWPVAHVKPLQRRQVSMVIRALPLLLLCAQAGAAAGIERTWYTPERIAVARRNVAEHDWAQGEQRRILETGDTIRYYMGPEYTS